MIDKDLVGQGRQYNIACQAGEVGRYVFLPGDPGRASLIAASQPRLPSDSRES